MFETSAFHADCWAMRQIYRAGGFEWGNPPGQDLAQLCDTFASFPLLFQPGSEWNYGVSTDVLGRLVVLPQQREHAGGPGGRDGSDRADRRHDLHREGAGHRQHATADAWGARRGSGSRWSASRADAGCLQQGQ